MLHHADHGLVACGRGPPGIRGLPETCHAGHLLLNLCKKGGASSGGGYFAQRRIHRKWLSRLAGRRRQRPPIQRLKIFVRNLERRRRLEIAGRLRFGLCVVRGVLGVVTMPQLPGALRLPHLPRALELLPRVLDVRFHCERDLAADVAVRGGSGHGVVPCLYHPGFFVYVVVRKSASVQVERNCPCFARLKVDLAESFELPDWFKYRWRLLRDVNLDDLCTCNVAGVLDRKTYLDMVFLLDKREPTIRKARIRKPIAKGEEHVHTSFVVIAIPHIDALPVLHSLFPTGEIRKARCVFKAQGKTLGKPATGVYVAKQ